MAHTHVANEGDYLKHVILEELLRLLCQLPDVRNVRYVDPYSGEGLFPRSPVQHIPTSPAGKALTWSNQQAIPDHYLGSPLIALQVLASSGLKFSLRLSDKDVHAIEVLRKAVNGEVAGYTPLMVPDATISVARYDGSNLASDLIQEPSAVNVVLLDPTRQDSYAAIIIRTIDQIRSGGCNAVLMCWGLRTWKWPEEFATDFNGRQAEYAVGRYPSIVHLRWFGELASQLASAASAATDGW